MHGFSDDWELVGENSCPLGATWDSTLPASWIFAAR